MPSSPRANLRVALPAVAKSSGPMLRAAMRSTPAKVNMDVLDGVRRLRVSSTWGVFPSSRKVNTNSQIREEVQFGNQEEVESRTTHAAF